MHKWALLGVGPCVCMSGQFTMVSWAAHLANPQLVDITALQLAKLLAIQLNH